jgi:hypothetical protein
MIETYCSACEKFTPLALEPMRQGRDTWVVGAMVCPQCNFVITRVKIDQALFKKLVELTIIDDVPERDPSQTTGESPPCNQPRFAVPPLRLLP